MKATMNRQQLRRLVADGARRVRRRTGVPIPVQPAPAPIPTQIGPLPPQEFAVEAQSVTTTLWERLRPEDVEAIEARIATDPELQHVYRHIPWPDRHRALISLGMHLGVDVAIERTGLPTAQPPESIHAMARGPLAAAGGLYEGDMIVDALASAGVAIDSVSAALDFGCSSGRVLRVLSAAYPRISWHGCDPNGDAVAWAAGALPDVHFFQSGDRPPLELEEGSLDLVYAISIWSHFAPQLGLDWLEEMRRLVKPGGHLVLTSHGTTTIQYEAIHRRRAVEHLNAARLALVTQGSWYAADFGEEGDWGVVNPDWGSAFFSAEWLLAHALPRWRLLEFAPGRNSGNQDVYVLQRA